MPATKIRMRSRVAEPAIRDHLAGKVLGPSDYDVLLSGAAEVVQPDGRPLCIFLPGAVKSFASDPEIYDVLHELRLVTSRNRGLAAGSRRLRWGAAGGTESKRSTTLPVASALVGSLDPVGQTRYCRLTAWTGRNLPEFAKLHPFLATIGNLLKAHVPDRYAAQAAYLQDVHPAWVIPGTPFTTITVNNTYPTGVHTDKGDLDEGFSTLACVRRGEYTGGLLVFPQYRVAVEMRDGDLLLMDAHQWHGNTAITCRCQKKLQAMCDDCGAERISVVSYTRTAMVKCGTPAEELERAARVAERRSGM